MFIQTSSQKYALVLSVFVTTQRENTTTTTTRKRPRVVKKDNIRIFVIYFTPPVTDIHNNDNSNINNNTYDLYAAGGKNAQFQYVQMSTVFALLNFNDILFINCSIMKHHLSVERYLIEVCRGEEYEESVTGDSSEVTLFTVDLEVNKWRRVEHHSRATDDK